VASTTIVGSISDNALRKYSPVSFSALLSGSAGVDDVTSGLVTIQRSYTGTNWTIRRPFFSFDVSALAGATITLAQLQLSCHDLLGDITWRVYYQDWGTDVASDDWVAPIDVPNLTPASAAGQEALGLGSLIVDLSNLGSLLTSNGRFVLIAADESVEPTGSSYQQFRTADYPTPAYRPSLYVEYTTGVPVISVAQVGAGIEVSWT